MRVPLTLGRESCIPADGFTMRLTNAALDCVVFVGFPDMENESINPVGTAFFLRYLGALYLVTCKHVSRALGDFDWVIRLNRHVRSSITIQAEPGTKWIEHPDENVDLAVLPFLPLSPLLAVRYVAVPGDQAITKITLDRHDIGVGDTCYTVGLFHVLKGKSRNLPVVHTGNIALMPGDELVPVRDWENEKRAREVEAYLVESQGLAGLSGSPVFVRPTINILRTGDNTDEVPTITVARPTVHLLGIFQAAWDAPPSEVLAIGRGKPITVPVGMGIVVPAHKLIELLGTPKMSAAREALKKAKGLDNAATLRNAPQAVTEVALDADNPDHKEDFMRLLNAAAQAKPEASKT
jgi:hypothetical protein